MEQEIFKWQNNKKNIEITLQAKGRFIMSAINITNARKELYSLVEDVNRYSEPALIVKKEMRFLFPRMIGMQFRKRYIWTQFQVWLNP